MVRNFSSVPILHFIQAVLFIEIWTILMNILFNTWYHALLKGMHSYEINEG
jgi:hypothetical protein